MREGGEGTVAYEHQLPSSVGQGFVMRTEEAYITRSWKAINTHYISISIITRTSVHARLWIPTAEQKSKFGGTGIPLPATYRPVRCRANFGCDGAGEGLSAGGGLPLMRAPFAIA